MKKNSVPSKAKRQRQRAQALKRCAKQTKAARQRAHEKKYGRDCHMGSTR